MSVKFEMKKGAMALIDVLGFKGIWQKRDPKDIVDLMHGIREDIEKEFKKIVSSNDLPPGNEFNVIVLSDTIVITAVTGNENAVIILAESVERVLVKLLRKDVLFRGALGYGEFMTKENIFVGPLVDEIASWYEQLDFVGVMVIPPTGYLIRLYPKIPENPLGAKHFIEYPKCQLKFGKEVNAMLLNFPAVVQSWEESHNSSVQSNYVELLFYRVFAFQNVMDASVQKKYERTLDFIRYSLDDLRNQSGSH